jgi:hypothetical protein
LVVLFHGTAIATQRRRDPHRLTSADSAEGAKDVG